MTPDGWQRLAYGPTPVHELRACHMTKLHVSVTRHLAESHGRRFERQVGLVGVTALHNELHGASTTNPWVTTAPHLATSH